MLTGPGSRPASSAGKRAAMKALDKKLWRELWAMRVQALAIALVIVSGVSIFIMSLSTLDSLYETRENYYRNNHFAHVFT